MSDTVAEGWLLFGSVVAAGVAFAFAYFLVKNLMGNIRDASTAREESRAVLLVVATLALIALIGALVRDSDAAWTFASLLGGALAAAVRSSFHDDNREDK